jgi:hypothetical protein
MQMVKKLTEKSVCTLLQPTHLRSLKNGRFCQHWQVMMLFCSQSLLGEFNKEQEAFIKEKQGKVSDAAVPPWVGCPNEESLKEEFLTLSTVSALKFIHRFCLITAAFFFYYAPGYTDTLENNVFCMLLLHNDNAVHASASSYTDHIACTACLCIRLHSQHCLHCMPLYQVTLATLLALHASVSGYTHNIACSACLCIRLHSQHCLLCLPLYQVTLTTLLALPVSVSGYTHNIACTACLCVWLHLQQSSLQ